MRRFHRYTLEFIAIAALTAVPDLILKNRIEKKKSSDYPRPLGKTGITLHQHHNYGFAMNRREDDPEMVRTVTSSLYAVFLAYAIHQLYRSSEKRSSAILPLSSLSLALILGGAFSNILDRIRLGYVVDYFSLPFRRIRHIIMNIGDLGIFLGSALIAIAGLTEN